MSVYVYSIVSSDHPSRLEGLRGVGDPPTELRTVRGASLRAVVSDAPEGLRAKRRDLMAHHAVQERLMTDGAVLPLRFGLTAADEDAVRDALETRAREYTDRLHALEGCVEYRVQAAQEEERLLRSILSETPQARRLNEEITAGRAGPDTAIALGELIAREVQARHEELAAKATGALRPHARDERPSPPAGEDFLNVSFLVDRGREKAFTGAEADLAERFGEGFDFRLHGPLPVYSFV
jgi:hypothetical protein